MRLWQAAGWPGDRTLSSVEHQTLEKFHGVLAEFGALDAVTGRMNLQEALACLRDLLSDTQFEPETASAAVTVIDSATSAGMYFDALWVTGLDADHIPAPVNPDGLIPLELQRTAGIPEATPAGVLQQAKTQLKRWTNSAPTVVLSWPQRDGDVGLHAVRCSINPDRCRAGAASRRRRHRCVVCSSTSGRLCTRCATIVRRRWR